MTTVKPGVKFAVLYEITRLVPDGHVWTDDNGKEIALNNLFQNKWFARRVGSTENPEILCFFDGKPWEEKYFEAAKLIENL